MNELSLFSGAGGGVLGSKILGHRIIGYVEYENYCQEILQQRIADGILDAAPIFGDIRKFISEGYAASYTGLVDLITGGFPCQDISVGNTDGKGIDGERSGLWKEMSEVIGIVRPCFVFVENSSNLIIRGGTRVIADLTRLGYDSRWGIIGADDVGAPHERNRIWIMAYAKRLGREPRASISEGSGNKGSHDKFDNGGLSPAGSWWEPEPRLDRVAYGIAHRMDRLKSIGNAQVPLCMARAFQILSEGIIPPEV